MLTPEQLADLRAKAKAATPGPWACREDKAFCDPNILEIHSLEKAFLASFVQPLEAAYIAAANPTTILQLLDTLELLQKEADWLAGKLAEQCHSFIYCPCTCPYNRRPAPCDGIDSDDWRKAAREALKRKGIIC